MPKPKVSRAIEPNVGRQKKFTKKVLTLLNDFRREVLNELILFLANEPISNAHDESLTFNPEKPKDRIKLAEIKRRINRQILLDPKGFQDRLDDFIARNMAKWVTVGDKQGQAIARWYVKNLSADLSLAQKNGLIASGVSPALFKKKWTKPEGYSFYVSPNVSSNLPNMVNETTGLITKLATNELAQIRNAFVEVFTAGGTLSKVEEVLNTFQTVDGARASRITLDQTLKLAEKIKTENCLSLGITEGVWIHVPGQYTSRKSHIAMNGKRFKLDEGLYDPEVKRKVKTGELYYCRCTYRSIIPDDLS